MRQVIISTIGTSLLTNQINRSTPDEKDWYAPSFKKDYEGIISKDEGVKLQETLARASYLLSKHSGDTGVLKRDGGLLYKVYENWNGIAHFRVTQGLRVSCVATEGSLMLRHYGLHNYVNDNP